MSVELKNYFCELPFTYTEIHEKRQTLCCPYWNDTNIKKSDNYLDNWFSDEAKEIRSSMLTGEWKNCSDKFCPHLSHLLRTGTTDGPIKPIEEFNSHNYNKPKRIKLCFDQTCNLKCPTCRIKLIPNTEHSTSITLKELLKLEESFSDEVEEIFTSGTGDPLYSKPMREYLINFPIEKYPKLDRIILHTNGILLTTKLWDKLKNVRKLIKQIEISIDAATKDTYENKTRLGGKWDVLMQNLKFVNKLRTVKKVTTSFVVQQANYKEIIPFVELMNKVFYKHRDHQNIFYRVANWGTFSEEEYSKVNVLEESHPEHEQFLIEAKKLDNYPRIISNLL